MFGKRAEKAYLGYENEDEDESIVCEICEREIPEEGGVVAVYCQAVFCSQRCLDRCRAKNTRNLECKRCKEFDQEEEEEEKTFSCPECGADITAEVEEYMREIGEDSE